MVYSSPRSRLVHKGNPVAVIDIGSNSIRLVVYEALARSPVPLFNEKILCGLGKGVSTTGRLDEAAVERACGALRRFRKLCDLYGVETPYVLATAASRDAKNGADFIARVEEITKASVRLLSGVEEARLAASGILSGFYKPDGIVGDLGGGSLELMDLSGECLTDPVSFPLGVIALADKTEGDMRKAEIEVKKSMQEAARQLKGKGRVFYAIGGTWRSLVKLHMRHRGYALHVIHAYTLSAIEALDFVRFIKRSDPETLPEVDIVNTARRDHLRYGALILEQAILTFKPYALVFSAAGVREGLLYSLLSEEEQSKDPLIESARDFSLLRSRDPKHGEELVEWTAQFFESAGLEETFSEARLRAAACHLSDIGWRAHPDYRAEESFNVIAHAPFTGIDHAGRAFLAATVYYRHEGVGSEALDPRLREMVSTRLLERARILGAVLRIGFVLSGGIADQLPKIKLLMYGKEIVLSLPKEFVDYQGERVQNRLKRLAKILNRQYHIEVI